MKNAVLVDTKKYGVVLHRVDFLIGSDPHSDPTIDVIWQDCMTQCHIKKNEDTCVSRYPLIGLN